MFGLFKRQRTERVPELWQLPRPPTHRSRPLPRAIEPSESEDDEETHVPAPPDYAQVLGLNPDSGVTLARITRLQGHMILPLTFGRLLSDITTLTGSEDDVDLGERFEYHLEELFLSLNGMSRRETVTMGMAKQLSMVDTMESDFLGRPANI